MREGDALGRIVWTERGTFLFACWAEPSANPEPAPDEMAQVAAIRVGAIQRRPALRDAFDRLVRVALTDTLREITGHRIVWQGDTAHLSTRARTGQGGNHAA